MVRIRRKWEKAKRKDGLNLVPEMLGLLLVAIIVVVLLKDLLLLFLALLFLFGGGGVVGVCSYVVVVCW